MSEIVDAFQLQIQADEQVTATLNNIAKEASKGVTVGVHMDADVTGVLNAIDKVAKSGKNITQLSKDLVGYIRDLLVVKTCKDYAGILKMPKAQLDELKNIADGVTSEKLLEMLTKLSRLENEYRYSTNPRGLFEISLVSLCKFEMSEVNELKMRVKMLEAKLSKGN